MSYTNIKVFQDGTEVTQFVESLNFNNVSVTDTGSNTASIEPIFGANFQFAEEQSETTTTSTTLQQKLRLTTTDLPAGLYRIGWSYRYAFSKSGRAFKGRVQLNDTIDLSLHVEYFPNDHDLTNDTAPKRTFSDHAYYSLSGINDIDIDFGSTRSRNTASIATAQLEVWQVGTDTTYTPGSVPGTLPSTI